VISLVRIRLAQSAQIDVISRGRKGAQHRTKARAILIDALRDAHHWLDDLTRSPNQTIEALAAREGKTERWIRRTLSLAFLCPTLVRAIDDRLPREYGVKRLMDLPMDWPQQWAAPG